MRVWLDDERPMPEDMTHRAYSYADCIALLATDKVEMISLDHDLGSGETGYDVLKWLEAHAAELKQFLIFVHSMNPVGRMNMLMAINNIHKIWRARDAKASTA